MVSSVDKFVSDLVLNVRASNPVTLVYTSDPNDTLQLIKSSLHTVRSKTDGLLYWSSTNGWTDMYSADSHVSELLARPNKLNLTGDAAKTPLALCFTGPETHRCRAPIFVVSLLTQHFKNDNIKILQELRDFDYITRNGINDSYRIIVLANNSFEIPADYENLFAVVRHDNPTDKELEATYDEYFINDYVKRILVGAIDGDATEVVDTYVGLKSYCVNTLNGLSDRQFKLILYKANSHSVIRGEDGTITGVDFDKFREFVYEQKFNELSRSGILTLLKPTPMDQVGGFNPLKSWLKERQWAFSQEAREAQVDVPKGMALIGPPGTGKTYIARATADALNFPCIQFNFDAIFNKFVGDSERNMRQALDTIEAMSPCVLFIDEIDKLFAGMANGGTDGGVSTRVFGKLLSWLQDNKKDIFTIVTANRIANVPSEFLRKGRLDEVWCVDFPDETERAEVIKIHLAKKGKTLKSLKKIVAATADFSSAELEYIVKEAVTQAAYAKETLAETHLLAERERVVPVSIAFAEDIRHMREWAETNARMASSRAKPIKAPPVEDGSPREI